MPRRKSKRQTYADYVTNQHNGVKLPWEGPAVAANPIWYRQNCCPQCGRVNDTGEICETTVRRDVNTNEQVCPLVTCYGMHDTGHWMLKTECPAKGK